ncbi:MAG: hypothetical protein KAQ62_04755, partial [Cyclobacteriaceae bacterium]|nr:hypothetical protein [Cyclobacteriaceae bacterium]
MKNHLFLLLVLFFYCMSFFSCKDNANKKANTQLFRKDSVTRISEDSIHLQAELNIESSIGIDTERGSWQNPDLVIEKLGDLSGKIIADIGSGT